MKVYTEDLVPKEDIILFERVRRSVITLPEINNLLHNKIISCHILARAIARVYTLEVMDGFFSAGFMHSWCLTKNKNIIDVYPVGIIGGPILLSGDNNGPANKLYRTSDINTNFDLGFYQEEFESDVKKVEMVIRAN